MTQEVEAAIVKFEAKKHKHRLESFVCKVLKQKLKMEVDLVFKLGKEKMALQGIDIN